MEPILVGFIQVSILLLDILHIRDCYAHMIKNHRFAGFTKRSEHLLKNVAYATWHNK